MVLRIIKHALWLTLSNYLIKGSDLALEVAVENSGGENKDEGTTYWSLKKSVEDPYYDLPQDSSPDDPDNNTTPDKSTYTADVTLENAWLKIQDKSNTTGAEMAIGNNAQFLIDRGGKIINNGNIDPASVELRDNGSFGALTVPGEHPELFAFVNKGEVINNGHIYGWPEPEHEPEKETPEKESSPASGRTLAMGDTAGQQIRMNLAVLLTALCGLALVCSRRRKIER